MANATHFDFLSFAKQIHEETGSARLEEPYLLPALYGGELDLGSDFFNAIIVLHEPLVTKTRQFWGDAPCTTTEMAIQRHREIFVQHWAYERQPFHFFTRLDDIHSHAFMPSTQAFFRHYYVTDTWKDAAPKKKRKEDVYRGYWRSKLRFELQNVPTKRIILVGPEAADDEILEFCQGVTTHKMIFPSRVSDLVLQAALARLTEEIKATL
jgi:hypothetical protein